MRAIPFLQSMDAWVVVSRVGDVATLVATAIAVAGLITAFLVRPRLRVFAEVQAGDRLMVFVWHENGSSPAYSVSWRWASLREDGTTLAAESGSTWGDSPSTVLLDEYRHIEFVINIEPLMVESPTLHRVELRAPLGVLCEVSWRRPLLPWLRARRVIRWSHQDRIAGRAPVELTKKAARDALRAAFPHTPPRIPPMQKF